MHAIVHVWPLNTEMSQQLDTYDTYGEYFNGFFLFKIQICQAKSKKKRSPNCFMRLHLKVCFTIKPGQKRNSPHEGL